MMHNGSGQSMQTEARILLVEDDALIVSTLTDYFAANGFAVSAVPGQREALEALALGAGGASVGMGGAPAGMGGAPAGAFDLALVDIALSNGNGFALCQAIKAGSRLPVIFLTASSDEYSTVAGFQVGADDYVAKPFRPAELLARVRNVLRLTGKAETVLSFGDVRVDTQRGTATKAGRDLYLSALEYRLLMVFLNSRGAVLSRAQLLRSIWDLSGDLANVSDNTVTVYVKRLRDKIEDDPANPAFIKTVRGLGYQMDVQ